MSKIKPERTAVKEILNGFAGIGPNGLSTGKAVDMRNFRLLSNGSLEKRCGWEIRNRMSGYVRAVWQGAMDDTNCIFVVCSETIYRLANGEQTIVGMLTETPQHAEFVFYLGYLYLFEDNGLHVYRENLDRFETAKGYAPLFGVNWHPTQYGETNEPLNICSMRLRVNYLNTEGATTFTLPFYAKSIDCLRVDNVRTSDFTFKTGERQVTVSKIGTVVEIAFTLRTPWDLYTSLRQCNRARVERFGDRETLMAYGDPTGTNLFCSSTVDSNMLNYCLVAYPDTDPLYVKTNNVVTVGDPLHPMTALCRHHDRMLAFHALGAAAVIPSPDSDAVEYYPLLRGVGCTATIDLRWNGDAIILNADGIFRLTGTAGEPDEIILSRLSEGVEHMLTKSFLTNAIAFSNPLHGELWFRDTRDSTGLVWVYQMAQKQWYCFDGIKADYFLSLDGDSCFVSETSICRFDNALKTDDGTPFIAYWQSGVLALSSPEAVKRALRVTLCAQQGGNITRVSLKTERIEKTVSIQNQPGGVPLLLDSRVPLGRFRLLQVRISDSGVNRSRYDRLALYANA